MGSEEPEFFGGKSDCGVQAFPPVKAHLLALGLGLAAAISVGEETSSQRLENAQRGMAGASWPKKPDNRLSPLSGKMKETSEISPRFYGSGKEFEAPRLNHVQKQAALGQKPAWEGGARVDGNRSAGSKRTAHRLEPSEANALSRLLPYRTSGHGSLRKWREKLRRTGRPARPARCRRATAPYGCMKGG